jgi:hypothetical protein
MFEIFGSDGVMLPKLITWQKKEMKKNWREGERELKESVTE